jgi:murein DD-endopeptidase MepM/ murein hydrolase activator NlpD
VVVEHRNGAVSLYAHHLRNLVSLGRWVGAGEVLALAGSTGRSTGPHLHFEVWKDGVNHTDAYVRNTPPAGLLPGDASDFIYRLVLADGRLLFTDVPVH